MHHNKNQNLSAKRSQNASPDLNPYENKGNKSLERYGKLEMSTRNIKPNADKLLRKDLHKSPLKNSKSL